MNDKARGVGMSRNNKTFGRITYKLTNNMYSATTYIICHSNIYTPFSQLLNKMCSQYCPFVASLLTSCDNAVPTTCQQAVFAIGL
jgi:hypothetical protein